MTAAGIFVADLIWVGGSVSGVTAALVASKPAFVALRWVGAAYLVYLGVRLILRRGVRPSPENPSINRPPARSGGSERRTFREGVICDLSNPKTVLVFTSVIPQFVPSSGGPADAAVLGIIFALLGFLSLFVYAVVLGSAHHAIRRPRLADGLLRASGGILVGFGVGLAIEPSD